MTELGSDFASEEELNAAFSRFKQLADKKHEIFDEDLQSLLNEADAEASEEEYVKLVALDFSSGMGERPQARVTIKTGHQEHQADFSASGGVVDASLKAIESLLNTEAKLTLYSVNNITSGTDAQGEVTVRLEKGGRIVNGQGADTDIVIASAKAYINAVNKLQASNKRKHPQADEVEV